MLPVNDFLKTDFMRDENGNLVLSATYDVANQIVKELTERKETLWKRFCQDVCEKIVSYYSEDSIDVIHFHKVFNEKFNETVKEWDNGK